MHRLTRFMPIVASVISVLSVALASASASLLVGAGPARASGSSQVPFSPVLRVCDFTNTMLQATGFGNGYSVISSDGATATAEIHLFNVDPDTYFYVRFIELPRPVLRCNTGDPGVVTGSFVTNYRGDATITLSQPVIPGAKKAWVLLEGPPGNNNMIAGDFYSSDFAPNI